ncbi:choice-of-anchor E domain-containing protein [Rugamonas aquatica]|uniref:Choice-of-anchor E domain-containing protein n=1 Tax=Rugamonas aquatica TaxID=2743357 RepID=A0A6A7N3Q6_9BURK|nr:choice-of-anchor E domain-containing protein [Rugamonas aquatica]MQA39683.1 choice-of-anchor E domain-containing protein [Rugamonas aquatica]
MKLNKITALLLTASCLMAGAASAVTLTVSNSSNVIVSQDTDWSDFLNFQKFNPALGTLTSVKFDLYSNLAGGVLLTNYNDDPADVPVTLDVSIFLDRPDSSNLVLISATLFNTVVTVPGGGGTGGTSNGFLAHNSATYSGPADLALFSGPGSINTLITAQANSTVFGDGIDVQFATTADGYGTVTYAYTPAVPEPETYGMLLLGMGLIGMLAKRQQARAKQA